MFPDEESRLLTSVTKLKSRLSDIMEPDFGLLDELLGLEVLTRRQYDDVCSERGAAYRRSEAILECLTTDDQCNKFVKASRTSQPHVVNFITQSGGKNRRDSDVLCCCKAWC